VTNHVGHRGTNAPRVWAALAALAVGLTACGDDPFVFDWDGSPDTVQLYSLHRPELNIPSAFSFYDRVVFPVEQTLLYTATQPVRVEAGTVYAIRTNRRTGSFGSSCVYYAKMEPVVIDLAEDKLTFRFTTSPICNSRELVPPD
jgi:hypothetical protein